MPESKWLAEVRLALGARPDLMLWRQHAGTFCPPSSPKVRVKVAPDGIADIMGCQARRVSGGNISVMETVRPDSMQPHERAIEWFYGQAIAIETKALRGRAEESQKEFEHAFRSAGGIYILAREGQWDVIYAALGEEADPVVAEKAQEVWEQIAQERAAAHDRKRERKQ